MLCLETDQLFLLCKYVPSPRVALLVMFANLPPCSNEKFCLHEVVLLALTICIRLCIPSFSFNVQTIPKLFVCIVILYTVFDTCQGCFPHQPPFPDVDCKEQLMMRDREEKGKGSIQLCPVLSLAVPLPVINNDIDIGKIRTCVSINSTSCWF